MAEDNFKDPSLNREVASPELAAKVKKSATDLLDWVRMFEKPIEQEQLRQAKAGRATLAELDEAGIDPGLTGQERLVIKGLPGIWEPREALVYMTPDEPGLTALGNMFGAFKQWDARSLSFKQFFEGPVQGEPQASFQINASDDLAEIYPELGLKLKISYHIRDLDAEENPVNAHSKEVGFDEQGKAYFREYTTGHGENEYERDLAEPWQPQPRDEAEKVLADLQALLGKATGAPA